MKGIILAGGAGTRLYPLTMVTSKQLLPVYDKPMVYYPLSTLMLAGINDILIISAPEERENFERLLGDGGQFGIRLSYDVQPKPEGIVQAFIIGEEYIGDDSCALVLGDNLFYGSGLTRKLQIASENAEDGKATVFGYYVEDPDRFGIMEFDDDWNVISVEEKPAKPRSNYCITGLYFYPNGVAEVAKKVKPYLRGELEGSLKSQILGRGFAWLDTGTMDSLVEATTFVQTLEKRQGVKISAPEEIAYRKGWITKDALLASAERYGKSPYGEHLLHVAGGELRY